jgi:UDP-glucose 4-epimerase
MRHRVYVTGAGGAIGQVLVPYLAAGGAEVVPLTHAAAPLPEASWYDPDRPGAAVVHLATEFHARTAGDAAASAALHVALFRRLVALGWRGRLVFASSAAVYAGSESPIPEAAEPAPPNPYGAHKLAVEHGLAELAAAAGLSLTRLRIANVYGTPLDLSRRRVAALLIDAARRGAPFTAYGDGSSLRDYVHVTDLVRAVQAALDGAAGLFNIGSGKGTRLTDLIALVERITAWRIDVRFAASQAEAAASVLDPSRAEAALGWRARIGIEAGLAALAAQMA